jgi:protein-disulfide isomerase
MIRYLLALLFAPILLGDTPAPRNWTKTVTRTADGAFVIGNPAAKVKLTEYLSYTCPHCAHYAGESTPTLRDKFIRSGSTSVELRHATRDDLDLAATVIARCTGPAGFAATSEQIFADQGNWFPRGLDFRESNGSRIALYPVAGKLRALADGSGLTDIGRAHGLKDAAIDACFADTKGMLQVAVMSDRAWKTIAAASPPGQGGTPTFAVNGKVYPTLEWAGLEKILRAAGAK